LEFYFYSDQFIVDDQYKMNENTYREIRKIILDENKDESTSSSSESDNDQSNIPAAAVATSSSGSSVGDKEN